MDHVDLYLLRETYNEKHISLCFNGPFSQGLIEEIGDALKRYMQSQTASSSATLDVFAVYIEIAQNIQQYSAAKGYTENEASATVVIGRDDEGHYEVLAGNVVESADGEALVERINALAAMDKAQLKAAYKEQLRKPRDPGADTGAGLGLIDIARKASAPISCSLRPVNSGNFCFFSLRVVI
ncbi:MAG: biofilm regulation protein kinase SiaB [Abitibacteriaceae bacterium]|nr:biofilm regulation protein kinase SiaB [Abditibacteriaceae bacterium]MBV9865865.1 biofilm regulation protein kinase SiaB [Abditibacteriaceae bacterium]